ncbi:MAG TPA: M28 family peptidase, partial [Streptosporangiaceae bacterium]|nr:M28 family peptidase [Streptosporangiaceae bacterium]
MDNTDASGPKGPSRRLFLSASAVAAAAVPLASQATAASAASDGTSSLPHSPAPDPALLALLRQIDPNRIKATIQTLVSFGTRHTASSQTDPARGIGAATAWVTQQMQAFAAVPGSNMTVQQQTFIQSVQPTIPVPTQITNVIATIQGTASPQRFYVVTGHLDSRCSDVLDFTSDAPGADDDGS